MFDKLKYIKEMTLIEIYDFTRVNEIITVKV